jgi:RNA polymerase sigma-70 factor (sigma-E family)
MSTDAEFAALFAGRAVALRRTAYLLCGDWQQAEDLTQTAFAKLYAAWPRLRDQGAAEAYLRRIVARAHVDETRRPWRRERPYGDLPDTAARADATDDRVVLLAALARVPRRQRACLVLRYFADCSVEDTAAALGCSEGTVKSNTSRGLDALRAALGGVRPDLSTLVKEPS